MTNAYDLSATFATRLSDTVPIRTSQGESVQNIIIIISYITWAQIDQIAHYHHCIFFFIEYLDRIEFKTF